MRQRLLWFKQSIIPVRKRGSFVSLWFPSFPIAVFDYPASGDLSLCKKPKTETEGKQDGQTKEPDVMNTLLTFSSYSCVGHSAPASPISQTPESPEAFLLLVLFGVIWCSLVLFGPKFYFVVCGGWPFGINRFGAKPFEIEAFRPFFDISFWLLKV